MRSLQTRDGVYLFLKAAVYGEDCMSVHSPSEKPSRADTDTYERVRERAYLLCEAEGRHEGGVGEYWHRARELIEAGATGAVPGVSDLGFSA